jgi:hypothetical protein
MGARHGKPTTVKHQRAKYLDRKQEFAVEAGVAKVLLDTIELQALDIATQGFQIQNLCQTIEAKDDIIADLQTQLTDRDDVCHAKDQAPGKGPGNSPSD